MSRLFPRVSRALPLVALLTALPCASSLAEQKPQPLMYFYLISGNGALTADGNGDLYGTTATSGTAPGGLLYHLHTDASPPVETIYQYGKLAAKPEDWTGYAPGSGMLLIGDRLYGTTRFNSGNVLTGSAAGSGTIFSVKKDGSDYKRLFVFDALSVDSREYAVNATGAEPRAPLVAGTVGGVQYLFGAAFRGGLDGTGTVFRVRADGTGSIEVLGRFGEAAHGQSFTDFDLNPDNKLKNANGVNPERQLAFGGDGYVYGTTEAGGQYGTGVIFRVTDGSMPNNGIEKLYEFPATITTDTNNTTTLDAAPDGAYPLSGPVIAADSNGTRYLYGTTSRYGFAPTGGNTALSAGTIFRMTLDGSNTVTVIHNFDVDNSDPDKGTFAASGATPSGQIIVGAGNMLIGTTIGGGALPDGTTITGTPAGTIFKIPLDDATIQPPLTTVARFTTEDQFTAGISPASGVVETSDGSLYGIAGSGAYGYGVIFKFGSDLPNSPLGVQPPVDNGGGSLQWYAIALLGMFALIRVTRRRAAMIR